MLLKEGFTKVFVGNFCVSKLCEDSHEIRMPTDNGEIRLFLEEELTKSLYGKNAKITIEVLPENNLVVNQEII